MSEYGNFPIYLKSSDIYMLDLKTGKYYKPDVNSDKTDSFHSWSSNSRWFVFSSKRIDSYFTRFFFSYVDKDGKAYKPFLLPQEDPEFYNTFLYAYNVPELTAYDPNKFLQASLDPKILPRETKDSLRQGLKPYLQ
jgi:hypothetical protein